MNTDLLEINEIFGPTIQGEGMAAGRHCVFIRTFGCNLECTWCDTAKTWATTQEKAAKTASGKLFNINEQRRLMEPEDVFAELKTKWDVVRRPTLVIISGGEPMMQARKLYNVTRPLFDYGNEIHVETAGTISPLPNFDATVKQYNVSPKLTNSGNDFKKRYKAPVLLALLNTGKARFKFVVSSIADFAEIDYIVEEVGIPQQFVQVMPEGNRIIRNIRIAQEVIDEALKRGYGLSFRSHILIWGAKEGV